MSDHPEGRPPLPDTTDDAEPAAVEETSAAPPAPTDARSTEAPEVSTEHVTAEPVDALGEVEEQELLPEAESTIATPGEALDALLPALEVTGHDGVDDALATLDDMAEKSVHEHVEVFDAVHEELRRTLDQAAER